MTISNNLFEKVMSLECGVKSIDNNTIKYWFNAIGEIREAKINLYEFTTKNCKDWAFKQGYELYSGTMSNDHIQRAKCLIQKCEIEGDFIKIIESYDETFTEPEAIIKACEWILEQGVERK